MTRHTTSLATMLCLIGGLTAACSTMPMSLSRPGGASEATVGVQMPATSEFSNGPTTAGGLAVDRMPDGSEFSSGPSSGGGAAKSRMPDGSEFSNGPK
jgi:hypothetical protein